MMENSVVEKSVSEKLLDCHLHTSFSGDSEADPMEQVQAARRKGLGGLTFTDHLDWDYREEPGLFDLDFDAYFKGLEPLKERESGPDFDIGIGLEMGLMPHLAERHRKLLTEYPFDYVIGSIHVVNGRDPYYDGYFKGKDVKTAYREYLSCMLENLEAFHDFDALGHLDYIVRYGQRFYGEEQGRMIYSDYADLLDEVLEFLIRHDIALEINTGAFRYGMKEPNPSLDILKHYHDLGGEKLTIGADAHSPEHVGIGFEKLPDMIHAAGFHSYFVYRNRKPREICL